MKGAFYMKVKQEVIHRAGFSEVKKVSKEEIKRLGTTIQDYLGGQKKPPAHLDIEEFRNRSMESCKDCNGHTNSGNVNITNLKNKKVITLPYVAVHTMAEHGKATYQGAMHQGAIDIDELKKVLA